MAVTTTSFLSLLKSEATIPSNQNRFSNADFLAIATSLMKSEMVPFLTSLNQEYFVTLVNMSSVKDEASYKIPYRATGRVIRDLKVSDLGGNYKRSIPYIAPEDAEQYQASGEPRGFTIRGDKFVMLPAPSSDNIVFDVYIEISPNDLVEMDTVGVVDSFDLDTGIVTLKASIAGFTTGQAMDVIDHRSGCSLLGFDLINTNTTGATIEFNPADVPKDIAVGDYVALAGQSAVVQLPDELTDALVTRTAAQVARAQGDFELERSLKDSLYDPRSGKMVNLSKLFTPRVKSQAQTIISRNGLLRRGGGSYRGGYQP